MPVAVVAWRHDRGIGVPGSRCADLRHPFAAFLRSWISFRNVSPCLGCAPSPYQPSCASQMPSCLFIARISALACFMVESCRSALMSPMSFW